MAAGRRWVFVLTILATMVGGCRTTEETGGGIPHEAHPVRGGFLLQTGHIQLGPRTGQNGVRWQGDGENTLEFSGVRDADY